VSTIRRHVIIEGEGTNSVVGRPRKSSLIGRGKGRPTGGRTIPKLGGGVSLRFHVEKEKNVFHGWRGRAKLSEKKNTEPMKSLDELASKKMEELLCDRRRKKSPPFMSRSGRGKGKFKSIKKYKTPPHNITVRRR